MNEENKIKQIVIISGKGGTGKTSVAASFASLFSTCGPACVIADCDVDAADMHLVTAPELISGERFISGNEAVIDEDNCVSCGKCFDLCRFGAVKQDRKTGKYIIDSTACEGCGVCADNCPAGAISFPERDCGEWMVSGTRYGTMVHAALHPGAENSGHLVTLVRTQASSIAEKEKAGIVLIDGPPGIGCPVIASITGSDYIVAVTEPTLSGSHDLMRVLELASHFAIPVFVCVNKWDINPEITELIEKTSLKKGADVIGRISWDSGVTRAQIEGKSAVEMEDSIAAKEIREIWKKLKQMIK